MSQHGGDAVGRTEWKEMNGTTMPATRHRTLIA
jgi:hypothetical protein